MATEFYLVDVFSEHAYQGNSLAVFPDAGELDAAQMLRVTQELRHFESVFLSGWAGGRTVHVRVFDLNEELPFAGHPILGAAAVLHDLAGAASSTRWRLALPDRTVDVTTESRRAGVVSALLDQGAPVFGEVLDRGAAGTVAAAFGLTVEDLVLDLPPQVVSTGLAYLIVPVRQGLDRVRIRHDLTLLLAEYSADFAYVLDVAAVEGRHWNNDGVMEDIATGSAAGPVGAYLVRHGVRAAGSEFVLRQGRFVGRPSEIRVLPIGHGDTVTRVVVGGEVSFVGRGQLDVLPLGD